MKSARRVNEKYVSLSAFDCANSVKNDCRGVCARTLFDKVNARSLAPYRKLFCSRRSECVCRGNYYPFTLRFEFESNLTDRGSLTNAVYADKEHDRGLGFEI